MSRRPKPTRLHVIENTGRPSRMQKHEPKPPLTQPEPPDFLDPYAKEEWARLTPYLYQCGILTELDVDMLACLCQSYARWRDAEDVLAEFAKSDPRFRGLLIRTTSKGEKGGGNTIQNPLIGIARQSMRDYLRLAAEFGLTPAARTRISTESVLVAQGVIDPAEKYFR